MVVDIFSVLVVAGLIVLGWRSGAVRQVVHLVAVVAVIVGVPFASPVIRDIIFGESGRASPGVEVTSMLAAGAIIYVSIALAGWVAVKVMRFVSVTLSLFDRMGGAAMGALMGAILVYLFAALVVMIEGPLTERDPDNRFLLQGGWLTGVTAEYNVLAPWQFPDLETLHRALVVGQLAEETENVEGVRDDESASAFLRDDRVQALLDDEELMEWVLSEHYPLTLADMRVREVLNDPVMMDRLQKADWKALKEMLEKK